MEMALHAHTHTQSNLRKLFLEIRNESSISIPQIYTQERLYEIMSRTCSFLDTDVTVKGHPMEEKIRDAIQLQTYDDPKDALKLYVGIAGIQHCGVSE